MIRIDPLGGLAVFAAVVGAGSFSGAARRLGVSKGAVSTQIARLEKRLGVRLLQRTTRYVRLTEAGSVFHAHVSQILASATHAEQAAQEFHVQASGTLRVTAPPRLAWTAISPLVPQFLRENPTMSLDLHVTNRFVSLVKDGFDLAVRASTTLEPNTIARRLGECRLVICASPEYLARQGEPKRPEDLAAHSCLELTSFQWGRDWPLYENGRELRARIHTTLASNDAEVLRQAAIAGGGILMLPEYHVRTDLRENRLRPLLDQFMLPALTLFAVYPDNRQISAKVRAFVKLLISSVSPQWSRESRMPPQVAFEHLAS